MQTRTPITCLAVFLLAAAPAYAQGERATLTGAVSDSSGAVIPGARVAIRNVATNVQTRTQTTASGIYYLPALPPGEYELSVESDGFRKAVVSRIPLSTGLTATVNVAMELGTVAETVEVQAPAVQLESQTSGLSGTIDTRKVAELPVLGRSPLAFSALVPGVIPTRGRKGAGNDVIGSATNSRIGGGLNAQNAILTDGGESRGTTSAGQAVVVPLPSVAEFKVETSNYSAEFGRSAGGIIQIATKSGTNEIHGEVYEYLRNDNLNANSWSNNRNRVARGEFKRNEFGAAIGGPIIRNKTFFFFNYEGRRQSTPIQFLSTVPTQAQRQGDFSQTFDRDGNRFGIYDFLTTRADGAGDFTRDPFPNNTLPQNRLNPVSRNLANYWPLPNRAGQGPSEVNNYFTSGSNVNENNSYFGRVDHNVSDKHRVYGRFLFQKNHTTPTGIESVAFPDRSTAETPSDSELLSVTSTFTPSILGELRFSHTRLQQNNTPFSEGFDLSALGFSNAFTSEVLYPQFPQINVQTYASGTGLSVSAAAPTEVGNLGGAVKNIRAQDTWQAQYHVTMIRNRHKIKAGVDLQLLRLHPFNSRNASGSFFFDRVYTQGPNPSVAALNSGHGLASFLLGVPIDGQMSFDPRLMLWQKYYGFYVQDDIQVNSRLTLNLGLRYEYLTPYAEKHGQVGYFDFDDIEPITGEKGVFKFIEPNGYQSDPNKNGYAPRVGLAYRFDQKTVVRAAGAIFYAANNGINAASSDFGNGTFVLNSLSLGQPNSLPFTPPQGGSLENPFAGGLNHPDRSTTFAGQNVRADRRDHPYASLYNWNLNVQRMLSPTLLAEVGYVGSRLIHSFWNRHHNANWPGHMELGNDLQQSVANPYYGKIDSGPLSFPTVQLRQLLLPYPQYSQVLIFRDPYGSGTYNSMVARLEKRYSKGISLLASYTLSKSILTTPESNSWLVGPNNAIWDPGYNKALDANDTPHRFVVSYLWDMPFGRGRRYLKSGPLSWVLGNWQLAGVHVLQAGRPAAITAPDTTGLSSFRYTHGRADRLADGALPRGDRTKERWFDTTAFATAAPYTLPNDSLTQSSIRTPGRISVDLSLIKNIPVNERVRMQLRGELYNVSNTPMFELRGASTEVSSRQFGQIIEGGGARNVQLGLRVIF